MAKASIIGKSTKNVQRMFTDIGVPVGVYFLGRVFLGPFIGSIVGASVGAAVGSESVGTALLTVTGKDIADGLAAGMGR